MRLTCTCGESRAPRLQTDWDAARARFEAKHSGPGHFVTDDTEAAAIVCAAVAWERALSHLTALAESDAPWEEEVAAMLPRQEAESALARAVRAARGEDTDGNEVR